MHNGLHKTGHRRKRAKDLELKTPRENFARQLPLSALLPEGQVSIPVRLYTRTAIGLGKENPGRLVFENVLQLHFPFTSNQSLGRLPAVSDSRPPQPCLLLETSLGGEAFATESICTLQIRAVPRMPQVRREKGV